MSDWGTVVAVSREALRRLETGAARARRAGRRWRLAALVLAGIVAGGAPILWLAAHEARALARDLAAAETRLVQQRLALSALARSQAQLLEATAHAPSIGTTSWGRRFEITKYVPRSPAYGRFNDGLTATLKPADPNARLAAVDPALVPYGSRLWIEGLGWYTAEDCGVAIKGFRLDLLTATRAEAMEFGRQRRFVIVVPPPSDAGSGGPAAGMIGFAPDDAGLRETAARGLDPIG